MKLSECGVRLIAEFEGFVNHVYLDAVGVETIGYGTTNRAVIDAYRGHTCTIEEALGWLRDDVNFKYGAAVNALPWSFTQAQFDSLTSFAYNLGTGIFAPGRSIRTALETQNVAQIGSAMRLYDKAGGRALPGLTRRRDREARLFASGDYGFPCVPGRKDVDMGFMQGSVEPGKHVPIALPAIGTGALEVAEFDLSFRCDFEDTSARIVIGDDGKGWRGLDGAPSDTVVIKKGKWASPTRGQAGDSICSLRNTGKQVIQWLVRYRHDTG